MKILALSLSLFCVVACAKDSLHNKRVPIDNEAYLKAQNNQFYANYRSQDAYMKDAKGDKTFFNNLFEDPNSEAEAVTIIDETDTGSLQKLSKEYKEQYIEQQQTEAISVNPKPVEVETVTANKNSDMMVSGFQLLEKAGKGNYVQVAAFSNYQEAFNITSKLLEFNNVVITTRDNNSGGKWYRVRVGPVENRDKAAKLQSELTKAGYKGSIIVLER